MRWGETMNAAESVGEPLCIKCGHTPCPSCEDWCDVLVKDEDGDPDLCCDGACTYAETEDAVQAWCARARQKMIVPK